MVFTCRYCKEKIQRDRTLYFNPYYYDPLWLHLEKRHEDLYDLMCDFDNPQMIEDLYEYNEEEFYRLRSHNSPHKEIGDSKT